MSQDNEHIENLRSWNSLNKSNAEKELSRVIFESINGSSPVLDRFSQWLMAGTAATAALLISQIGSLVPIISMRGFKTALVMLIVSAVFGLLAKRNAIICQISVQIGRSIRDSANAIFLEFDKAKEEIDTRAAQAGLELDTDLSFSNVIEEFVEPFPWYLRWSVMRNFKKGLEDQNLGSKQTVKRLLRQGWYTFAQVFFYFAFALSTIYFAQAT